MALFRMIYRGPGLLIVAQYGSSPTPSSHPLSRQARTATHKKTEKEGQLADREGGGEGGGKARSYDCGESLVLYKSFNTLWDQQWKLTIWKTIFHFEADQELDPDLYIKFCIKWKI